MNKINYSTKRNRKAMINRKGKKKYLNIIEILVDKLKRYRRKSNL